MFTSGEEKERKNQFSTVFEKYSLDLREKKVETHKLNLLSITWILKKLNSIQTFVAYIPEIKLFHWYLLSKTYKKSHSKKWTLTVLHKFVCYPNNSLVSLQILSYRESTVVAPISSLSFILLLLAFNNTDSILKYTHSVDCQDFQHKTISGIFIQLSKKSPYFCPIEIFLNKIASIAS